MEKNPLPREPLPPEQIKPRLLGRRGTSPALSFTYVHLNSLNQDTDASVIYLTARGTAAPRELFRQFSSPGGIPSHVSVPTPISIHEGGELG